MITLTRDIRGCRLLLKFDLGVGGAEGDRTPDLMNAIHALSQLSYGPVFVSANPGPMSVRAIIEENAV